MLARVQDVSTSSGSGARQISITSSGNGVILYTVPAGKTFIGLLTSIMGGGSTNGAYSLDINGAPVYVSNVPVPITLVSGTIVRGSGYNTTIFGVEQ